MPSRNRNSVKMFKLKTKNNTKWNRSLFEEPGHEGNLPPPQAVQDILTKDIFNENDLEKMTPDYSPSELVLRMELRSSMVRDSHFHPVSHRKNFKSKPPNAKNIKDISRVSRELAKIKDNLHTNNVKNNIMMKHTSHRTKAISKKSVIKNETVNLFVDNEISFMSEIDNSFNSERELLSERDETYRSLEVDDEVVDFQAKEVNNSDDIEDVQTALSLATLYAQDNNSLKDQRLNENLEESIVEKEIKVEVQLEEIHTTSDKDDYLQIFSLSNKAKDRYLAKKYSEKWRQFTIVRKGMSELRKKTLNDFFERLMKEKCELKDSKWSNEKNKPKNKAEIIAHDQSSYRHRYQVQKNIIALQKLKLEEQNRLIEELKYNRIVEASKDSTESMRDVLKNTYADMDRRMKPKIKSLTNELKLHDIEEPALVLHCLKVPQFLQRMEKRAREREEKHAMIRERRRQMEEERLRLKQQAELAKAEMDKEEKAQCIKELKEKRKQEKIESIRRKQYKDRMRALTVMADLHYERTLMVRCGLRPWLKLIEMKRENTEKAEAHYEMLLKRNVFLHWMWHTEDMLMERNWKADECYRKKLLRKCFDALKKNHRSLVLKQQVADDYYDLYVQQLVFRKFRISITLLRQEREEQEQTAVKYYESNLLFRTLTHWRVLPALNRLQRERDARKTRWRQKVLLVVPDYKPPDDF